jgi:hypothetical protein
MVAGPFTGTWTYRSLLNDPDGGEPFDQLESSGGGAAPAVSSFYAVRAG